MASTVCCAAGNPVFAEYTPQGKFVKVGEIDVYIVGSGTSAILSLYDIFGFKCYQIFRVCDTLAAAGFLVAAPDLLCAKPWPLDKFPPKPEDDIYGWFAKDASYETVGPKAEQVAEYLRRQHNVSSLGTIGFCWGALIGWKLGATGKYSAAAGAHPSFFGKEKELCAQVKCPVAVIAAQGDPCETVEEAMSATSYKDLSIFKRYDDQVHGFLGARGTFDARAFEAIDTFVAFFKKTVV